LQKKAQTRSQKISDEDCDSEPGRSEPLLPATELVDRPTSSLFSRILQHTATSPGDLLIKAQSLQGRPEQ
jgi:hypothetical protein